MNNLLQRLRSHGSGGQLALYKQAQEQAHAQALAEIVAGRKTSHWIWWEWPAFTPVRTTSRPEYDLASCAAATAWLSDSTLGSRWIEITTAAVENLEKQVAPFVLFGSSTDAAKFQENVTLVTFAAHSEEQRTLAKRALRALALPPHKGVEVAARAELDRGSAKG